MVCLCCYIQTLICHISIEGHILVSGIADTGHGTTCAQDIFVPIRQITVHSDGALTGNVQGSRGKGVALDHCDLTAPVFACHIDSGNTATQHLGNGNHAVYTVKVNDCVFTNRLSRGQAKLACTGNGSIPLMQQIIITAVVEIRRSHYLQFAGSKCIGLYDHIGIALQGNRLSSTQGKDVNIYIAAFCIPCGNTFAKHIQLRIGCIGLVRNDGSYRTGICDLHIGIGIAAVQRSLCVCDLLCHGTVNDDFRLGIAGISLVPIQFNGKLVGRLEELSSFCGIAIDLYRIAAIGKAQEINHTHSTVIPLDLCGIKTQGVYNMTAGSHIRTASG